MYKLAIHYIERFQRANIKYISYKMMQKSSILFNTNRSVVYNIRENLIFRMTTMCH